jgi:hypothetical protein
VKAVRTPDGDSVNEVGFVGFGSHNGSVHRYQLVIITRTRTDIDDVQRLITLGRGITAVDADPTTRTVLVVGRGMAGVDSLVQLASRFDGHGGVASTDLVRLRDPGGRSYGADEGPSPMTDARGA